MREIRRIKKQLLAGAAEIHVLRQTPDIQAYRQLIWKMRQFATR